MGYKTKLGRRPRYLPVHHSLLHTIFNATIWALINNHTLILFADDHKMNRDCERAISHTPLARLCLCRLQYGHCVTKSEELRLFTNYVYGCIVAHACLGTVTQLYVHMGDACVCTFTHTVLYIHVIVYYTHARMHACTAHARTAHAHTPTCNDRHMGAVGAYQVSPHMVSSMLTADSLMGAMPPASDMVKTGAVQKLSQVAILSPGPSCPRAVAPRRTLCAPGTCLCKACSDMQQASSAAARPFVKGQ